MYTDVRTARIILWMLTSFPSDWSSLRASSTPHFVLICNNIPHSSSTWSSWKATLAFQAVNLKPVQQLISTNGSTLPRRANSFNCFSIWLRRYKAGCSIMERAVNVRPVNAKNVRLGVVEPTIFANKKRGLWKRKAHIKGSCYPRQLL